MKSDLTPRTADDELETMFQELQDNAWKALQYFREGQPLWIVRGILDGQTELRDAILSRPELTDDLR
jgi:hypothetical protein